MQWVSPVQLLWIIDVVHKAPKHNHVSTSLPRVLTYCVCTHCVFHHPTGQSVNAGYKISSCESLPTPPHPTPVTPSHPVRYTALQECAHQKPRNVYEFFSSLRSRPILRWFFSRRWSLVYKMSWTDICLPWVCVLHVYYSPPFSSLRGYSKNNPR